MLGIFDGCEAILLVKTMGVIRDQYPAAHFLQIGMLHDGLQQPFPQTMGAVIFVDENIAQVGEDRVIGDHSRHTDLPIAIIDAEGK